MNFQTKQLDFTACRARARRMTDASLAFAANDAAEATDAAEELERAGCRVSKTGGYYRDEAAVYREELRRRDVLADWSAYHKAGGKLTRREFACNAGVFV